MKYWILYNVRFQSTGTNTVRTEIIDKHPIDWEIENSGYKGEYRDQKTLLNWKEIE